MSRGRISIEINSGRKPMDVERPLQDDSAGGSSAPDNMNDIMTASEHMSSR